MGDSTLMTVEFLRARLLSERSVSRTAKQRADELGKRVMELEEQLRSMMIQRKKAEKAVAKVLTILENQGIDDLVEITDSSSVQDDANGGLEGGDVKEDETSTASRKSEVEDGSPGSELESPPSQGGSLSWKGRSSSTDSHENQKIKQIRQRQRHHSLSSTIESSGKHHIGKSCRVIRQREMRSEVEDEPVKPILDAHGKRGATHSNHSDGQSDFPSEASRNGHTSGACSVDVYNKEIDRRDGDEEMERVLEQQAQLIGQYQAEENAQREWEEKYNETKITTLDSCEPENRPSAVEISSEFMQEAEATELTGENLYYAEEAKSKSAEMSNTEEPTAQILSNASVPATETPHSTEPEQIGSDQEVIAIGLSDGFVHTDLTRIAGSSQACSDGVLGQYNGILIQDSEAAPQEFAFPAQENLSMRTNADQNQGMLYGNADTGSHRNQSLRLRGNGFIESPSSGSPSSVNSGGKFSKPQSPEMQNQLLRLQPQSPSSRLGGVLQALQRAKTSLGQLSGLPLSSQGTLATVAPSSSSFWTPKYGGDLEIPTGSAGLFRLPSDSFSQSSLSLNKFHGPGSSSTSTCPDIGYAGISNDHQYPTSTYVETGSRVSVGRQYFDPYTTSATGMRPSSRYTLPYTHLTTERIPSREGFSKSGMDVRNEMPAGDRYSLYGGHGAL